MRWVPLAALTAALVTAPPALAEDDASPLADSVMSLSLSLDLSHAYYFRGYINEDEGLVAQPALEVGLSLFEGDGALASVDLFFGLWNSFHTGPTGEIRSNDGLVVEGGKGARRWYEADLYAGLAFGLPGDLELAATYYAYTSPNASFETIGELLFELAWDDSERYGEGGAFGGLQPSLSLGVEIDPSAVYIGVGLEPTFHLVQDGAATFDLSLPLELGLSGDGYYVDPDTGDNDLFGYFSFAARAAAGLGFIAPSWGAWEVYLQPQALVLGAGAKHATVTPDNMDGDDFVFVFTGGVSVDFE